MGVKWSTKPPTAVTARINIFHGCVHGCNTNKALTLVSCRENDPYDPEIVWSCPSCGWQHGADDCCAHFYAVRGGHLFYSLIGHRDRAAVQGIPWDEYLAKDPELAAQFEDQQVEGKQEMASIDHVAPVQIVADATETVDGWAPQIRVGGKIVWQGDAVVLTEKQVEQDWEPDYVAVQAAEARIREVLATAFNS